MKKQMTRILSIMMTIVMILTMLPITAFAEETKVQIVNAYELATKSKNDHRRWIYAECGGLLVHYSYIRQYQSRVLY